MRDRGCEIPETLRRQFPEGYNTPEKWKGRKKAIENLDADTLNSLKDKLFDQTTKAFMSRFSWKPVYELKRELTEALRKYAKYLEGKKQKLSNDEDVIEPTVLSDKYHSKVLNATKYIKPILATRYKTLRDALQISEPYKPIFMNEYSSCDRRRRFEYVKEIVVPVACQQYTYTGGQEHLHWIWRTIPDESQSDALQNYMRVTVELQSKLPVYISRSIKREFVRIHTDVLLA